MLNCYKKLTFESNFMKQLYLTFRIGMAAILMVLMSFTSAYAQKLSISTKKKWYCPDETAVLEATNGFAKYLWNTSSRDRTIKVQKAGKYWVTAWDSLGKPQSDTIEIFYYKTKSLSISTKNNPICKGDSVMLEATSGFKSYQWSTNETTRLIKVAPTATTTYWVYGTDSNGCPVKAIYTLQVKSCSSNPCQGILAGNPTKMCKGGFIYLEAKNGFKTYTWSNKKTDRVIKITEDGWYYVTVTDSANNTCTDSIKITYFDVRKVEISANPSSAKICKGHSITLSGSNGFKTYSWKWNNDDKMAQSITVTPMSNTTYILSAVDSNGCTSQDTIEVKVDSCSQNTSCPDLIKSKDYEKCAGDSVLLEGPSGYKYYFWGDGRKTFSQERKYWAKEPGMYILMVKDSTNNICIDTVWVKNKTTKSLQAGVYPAKNEYCIGDTLVWEASAGFASYYWSVGETKRAFKMVAKSTFEMKLTATDSNGCKVVKIWKINVKDCSQTKDSCAGLITVYPKNVVCEGDSIKLLGKEGMSSYNWSNRKTDRYFWVKESGTWILEAKTPGGKTCIDSVKVTVNKKSNFSLTTKPNPAIICPGDTVVFEATKGMKSYSWNLGSNYNTNYVKLVMKEGKKVVVEATDANGCNYRAEVTVKIDSACQKNSHKGSVCKEIKVYPNPVKNKLTLEMKDTLNYDLKIEIFDRYSKNVMKDVWKSGNSKHTMDLSGLSSGYYLMKIHCKDGVILRKIFKQ